jgi:hypothetical protein
VPDPITIGAALTAAGSSTTLVNNIVMFVKNAQKAKQDPRMADVLARIPVETFALAGQYLQEIQNFRQVLLDMGVDLEMTQEQALDKTGKLQFRRRGVLTGFSARVNAIETQLSRLLEDCVAVSDCCGGEDLIVTSFVESEEFRTVISRELDPGRKLGDIIRSLEGRAQDMRNALGDLTRGK